MVKWRNSWKKKTNSLQVDVKVKEISHEIRVYILNDSRKLVFFFCTWQILSRFHQQAFRNIHSVITKRLVGENRISLYIKRRIETISQLWISKCIYRNVDECSRVCMRYDNRIYVARKTMNKEMHIKMLR